MSTCYHYISWLVPNSLVILIMNFLTYPKQALLSVLYLLGLHQVQGLCQVHELILIAEHKVTLGHKLVELPLILVNKESSREI